MRVCPHCGFSDNFLWENCRFKRDLQVMRIEDFKIAYPSLLTRIDNEKYLRDGQFVYHKTGKYVLRKEPMDFNQPFWEMFEAKGRKLNDMAHFYNRRRDKKQSHLFSEGFFAEKSSATARKTP